MKRGYRLFRLLLTMAVIFSITALAGLAQAASISGTVTYAGSKTGRIYITAPANNGNFSYGTSISAPGPFTIRGVAPGSYTLNAYLDSVGSGTQGASAPTGAAGSVTVQTSDVTANISLGDPSPGTAQTPTNLNVSPSSGGAFISWDGSGNSGVETVDSYSIYWSTNPSFTPATATGSRLDIPVGGDNFFIQNGLSNGSVYYYLMTAKRGANVSAPSSIVGPITIGASGGSTVSGSVTFSGFTPAGPLYVVVHDDAGQMFVGAVTNPSGTQSFSVPGVPNGTFFIHAIVDTNNNGVIDAGDIVYPNDNQNVVVTVNGDVVAPALTIAKVNAQASVRTNHFRDSGFDSYNLNFNVRQMAKLPVSVTLVGGPSGISYPVDLGKSDGEFQYWTSTGRPALTDSYSLSVVFSDTSSATLNAPVTGVVDTIPSPIGPTGNITDTVPTFSWNAPSPLPVGNYSYSLWLNSNSSNSSWYVDVMPSSQTSVLYNFDHSANQPALSTGVTYNWGIQVEDAFGNQGSAGSSFTPQAGEPGAASGTYTFDSGTGLLSLNWTSSSFACDGPPVGPESETVATLTATTMTWVDSSMTWARNSGSIGDILGTWNSPNKYTVIFNADHTVSVTGTVFCSGNGGNGGNGDTQPPTVPTGVNATPAGPNQVNLTWNPSSDNVGVSYYKIFRNGSFAGQPAGPNNTLWQDNSLLPGSYSYTVSACDQANNCSSPSASSQATLTGIAQPGAASGTYSFNPATGLLNWTFASSTFPCGKGPNIGPDSVTVASLTETSMTWSGDNMIWTRASGSAGSILGAWSSTDSSTNNTYNLLFNADFTVTVTGTINSCSDGGGGGGSNASVPQASIQVDGNLQDWANIGPVLNDPSGDSDYTGLDITGISMAQDGQNIYFKVDRAGNSLPGVGYSNFWFYLRPASPGKKGYAVNIFYTSPTQYSAVLHDISANPDDYNTYVTLPNNVPTAVGGPSIEFAIPKGAITVEDSFNLTFFAHHTDATGLVWQNASDQNDNNVTVFLNPGANPAPQITGFSPASGKVGSLVVINGGGFDPVADNNIVNFNGVKAQVTQVNPGQLFVTVPAGASNGQINLSNSCGSISSAQSFTVIPGVPAATLSWGSVYHRVNPDGSEFDVLDAGINSYASTLAGMALSVTLPDGSLHNFTDDEISTYIKGQLAVYRATQTNGVVAGSLAPGVYTFTLNDGQGHLSHRVATYAPVTKLPLVDSSTIQYQRKADGSYRISWAPVSDTRTYYYRLRLALDNSASTPIYDSQRDLVTSVDVPAGTMFDGASYKARVEVFDAPVLYINRSSSPFLTFTPNASDYNPNKVLVSYANLYSRAVTDSTFATVASLGVSNISAVTLVELTGPNNYKYTFDMTPKANGLPTDSTTYTTTGLSSGQNINDFYHEFSAPLTPGAYTYRFVANGIEQFAYVTLSAPVAYPAPDPTTCQAEDLGNGSIRYSWANVDHLGALQYRVTINDKTTGLNYNSPRKNLAFVDIPKTALSANSLQWRAEVHDSANGATLRNRRNGAWVPFAPVAYDPARPVISNFRVRNMTKFSGVSNPSSANYAHYAVSATASQGTLAQILVTGPGGFSRDLLALGRYSSDFNGYLLEEAGSPAKGLYTITVKDSAGRTSVRYIYNSGAHPVPQADFRTIRADYEPNGDLRFSWAPVISDVPLWYQVHVFAANDLNGDKQMDRVYVPYILKDTNSDGIMEHVTMYQQASLVIPAADLVTIPDPNLALIRTFDGEDTTAINNYSQSVMVGGGSQAVGLNFATLTDNDNDGYASNADGNDADASVHPFPAAVASPLYFVQQLPAAGSSNAPTDSAIGIMFNNVLNQSTLPGKVTLLNGVNSVAGVVTFNPGTRTVSFIPSAPLVPGFYTVTIGAGVKDEFGNTLTAPISWSFATTGTVSLALTLDGTGNGQVNNGMLCSSGGACTPGQFAPGASVTLFATASGDSVFGGWSGACSGLGGCTVFMDAAKSVTATFTTNAMVKVMDNGKGYGLMQPAYDDAATLSGYTIMGRAVSLVGNLTLNRAISLTFNGGYDSSFLTPGGETVVHGKLFIQKGRLTAKKLTVW